ncbi:MAG: protein kinase [Planctomycetota bacterium]
MDRESSFSDDAFASELEAYDEAIAEGKLLGDLPAVSDGKVEEGVRLDRALECLFLLERVWPRNDGATLLGPIPQDDESIVNPVAEVPRRFGRFEIRRQLGRGGFAVVYLAFDPQLGKEVALKVPRPDVLVSRDLRRRFFREAEAAAELDHPNIVSVHDVGELGPACYITSSFCNGPTLDEWIQLRNEQVDENVAAGMVATLADAVQHAHERGVLHRDIKPGNILLERGVPKLTDFGLAKLIEAAGEETRSGALLGTPRYMAPEQIEAKSRQIGPWTDVYGLGAVLYELLTGTPPFSGTTDLETLWRVLWTDVVPPSKKRSELSRVLEAICLKCLEKKPAQRYASARELAADLRSFQEGRRTVARPHGLLRRAGRWADRNRAGAALLAVSFVALLLAVLGWSWHVSKLEVALRAARTSREQANQRGRELKRREKSMRQFLYAADLGLAYEAYKNGDTKEVLEHLHRHESRMAGDEKPGFEWHYLHSLCNRELVTLRGHEGSVYHAAFSPDMTTLASASQDGTVRVWEVPSGRIRWTLSGHTDEVNWVCFSPDGKLLASVSDDHTTKLWDPTSGKELATLRGHDHSVYGVEFTPDQKWLVTAGADRQIVFWDVATRTEGFRFTGHKDSVTSVCVSQDGKLLASGSSDREIRIWDLETRKEKAVLQGHDHGITQVEFDPRARLLVSAGRDATVRIWNVATSTEYTDLRANLQWVRSASFGPKGKTLATCGMDDVVRLWDIESAKEIQRIHGHTDRIWSVMFSRDRKLLATASSDHTIKLWDLEAPQEPLTLDLEGKEVKVVRFSPDSHWMAAGLNDGKLLIWNLKAAGAPAQHQAFSGPIHSLDFHPHEPTLASCGKGDRISLWKLNDGKIVEHELEHGVQATSVRFSPDGATLYAGCQDGTVRSWRIVDGSPGLHLSAADSAVSIDIDESGHRMATVGNDETVKLWSLPSGNVMRNLTGHRGPVNQAVFAPSGQLLVTCGQDRSIKHWQPDYGVEFASFQRHRDSVQAVAFSANGRILASAASGTSVILWDVQSGQAITEFQPALLTANTIALSADGKRLVVGGMSPTGEKARLVIWEVRRGSSSEGRLLETTAPP